MIQYKRKFACLLSFCLLLLSSYARVNAQETQRPPSFTVLNYLTGWQLDTEGYHPAVFMMVENTSGQDLSGTRISLQARFTDLQTAEVSIGRKEIRRDLKPHQQFSVSIQSSQAFELPYQIEMWPRIEAKIMCRIGDVGDEGTQTLMIAKVETVTHTEEEAFQNLNEATSYAPRRQAPPKPASKPASRTKPSLAQPEKPLLATAQKLAGESSAKQGASLPSSQASAIPSFLKEKGAPGLGDDFFKFEQHFGLPQEFDAKHSQWTWARYLDHASGSELVCGAYLHRAQVDVIIAKIPKIQGLDENTLAGVGHNLAGTLHAQALSYPKKSVRYLPAGRVELLSCAAAGYRLLCLSSPIESDNCFILVLSRDKHDVEQLLATEAKHVSLLKCIQFLALPPTDPRG